MSQKEIIYLSFGSFSNHISTHFWNQQQSYFTYDQSCLPSGSSSRDREAQIEDELLIDHDVSFQAGQTLTGQDTYNPRAIIFETEQEFGALNKLNALYDSFPSDSDERNVALDSLQSWGTEAEVIAAERVRTSKYQRRLELEDQGLDPGSSDEDDEDVQDTMDKMEFDQSVASLPAVPRQRRTKRVHRFWSDYSRTFFHSKSLISVGGELTAPMPGSYNSADQPLNADGRTRFETFSQGTKHFDELEGQQEVLDSNIRWFAEDANLLQGFQYSIDTSDAFGGLGSKYLENLVDEFPKVSHLVFGSGWGNTQDVSEEVKNAAWENRLSRIRRMNNVQSLVQFMEFSTVVTPLSVPSWAGDAQVGENWRKYLGRIDLSNMHHAAALVSAHLETATLGTRMKSRSETLSSLTSRLNWRKDTKLVHLGGVLPLAYPKPLGSYSGANPMMDPVDALLQSYGYGDRDARQRQRGAPLESESDLAARGAKLILSSWLDLSLPSTLTGGEKIRKKLLYNLSRPYSHTAVLRNTDHGDARLGLGMLDSILSHIRQPFGEGVYIPQSYNVLSSFPNFFTQLDSDSKPVTAATTVNASNSKVAKPKDVPMLSSLSATPSSVYLLKEARETVSEALKGHAPIAAYGLDGEDARDGLKEIREQIEGWIDAYSVNNDGASGEEDGDGMGTDEEYDVDQKEDDGLDWDM
ncbi:related to DML1 - essential protein involved in mtDNA inheritance [Ustilago trichophora]|uniref:Related to DML1 - essential protein involved in mtDNA inheritance n=1 Tax=Ustilago trichophora TaxID=86804 RepID=A0A5C3E087_9BASI|nr:related to DML1 - essential protein involved in mtDNA inheritance [Ustilago trichophora]